jgi:hypothetical protein
VDIQTSLMDFQEDNTLMHGQKILTSKNTQMLVSLVVIHASLVDIQIVDYMIIKIEFIWIVKDTNNLSKIFIIITLNINCYFVPKNWSSSFVKRFDYFK